MSSQAILMDTAEVAARLNLTPERIRQLSNAGSLPAERTGSGRRVFHLADVERFELNRSNKNGKKASAPSAGPAFEKTRRSGKVPGDDNRRIS